MRRSTPAERLPRCAAGLRAHDLLELTCGDAIVTDDPLPEWVRASLRRAPFVVVRRAAARGALVPVGVRGSSRSERYAAWLHASRVARLVRPEDLVGRPWGTKHARQLAALRAAEGLMAAHRLRWGPVGSVGFELATGIACVTSESDVDLIARAPSPLDPGVARRLHAALAALPVRVDVQLETPRGGVSLAEYAAGAARVVLRTPDGPRWAATPWELAELTP